MRDPCLPRYLAITWSIFSHFSLVIDSTHLILIHSLRQQFHHIHNLDFFLMARGFDRILQSQDAEWTGRRDDLSSQLYGILDPNFSETLPLLGGRLDPHPSTPSFAAEA